MNGHEIGRYWLLRRGNGTTSSGSINGTGAPTQQYYHVPTAWLVTPGDGATKDMNTLIVFETAGSPAEHSLNFTSVAVAQSSMATGPEAGGAGGGAQLQDLDAVASCTF